MLRLTEPYQHGHTTPSDEFLKICMNMCVRYDTTS